MHNISENFTCDRELTTLNILKILNITKNKNILFDYMLCYLDKSSSYSLMLSIFITVFFPNKYM